MAGSMRAGLKALVVLIIAGVFMGGLTLVAPAAPLKHAQAIPPTDATVRTTITDITVRTTNPTIRTTDLTVRTTDLTVRTDIVLTGTVNVTVKGPGTVNGCGPGVDGSTTQQVCSFSGDIGTALGLTAAVVSDAHTQGQFTGWTGALVCAANPNCSVTVPPGTLNLTATFKDTHAAVITGISPADNQLVISPTGSTTVTPAADETIASSSCQVGTAQPG